MLISCSLKFGRVAVILAIPSIYAIARDLCSNPLGSLALQHKLRQTLTDYLALAAMVAFLVVLACTGPGEHKDKPKAPKHRDKQALLRSISSGKGKWNAKTSGIDENPLSWHKVRPNGPEAAVHLYAQLAMLEKLTRPTSEGPAQTSSRETSSSHAKQTQPTVNLSSSINPRVPIGQIHVSWTCVSSQVGVLSFPNHIVAVSNVEKPNSLANC